MIGNRPFWNDSALRIVTTNRNGGHELYLVGGCAQGDDDPSSDIYRMELKTMEWTNLTVRLILSYLLINLRY